jgi:hypothetical protein
MKKTPHDSVAEIALVIASGRPLWSDADGPSMTTAIEHHAKNPARAINETTLVNMYEFIWIKVCQELQPRTMERED